MKWTRPGHEFDKDYENMKKIKELYLFGAGHDGRMVASVLSTRYKGYVIKGFIDNQSSLWNTKVDGFMVYSPASISLCDGVGIVISFASEFTDEIDCQIEQMGFTSGENYWHFEQFISVYAAYKYDEAFFSSICILPTDACNLRCKACLNFTKYIKNFTNQPLEKLKKEIDLYFSNIDYTGLFFISGGEPFLYPELPVLIKYIDEKYQDKMYEFGIVTNGTIDPTDELLETLKTVNIKITFDDYRDAVLRLKEKITHNFERIKAQGKENVSLRKYDEWISLYPHNVEEISEKELEEKYNRCHCPWQEYKNGCLYSCNYASFAYNAGIDSPDNDNEIYSLYEFSRDRKKQLIEFRLGYTKKGYVEFCKKCAGYMDINPFKVKAAEQEE